MRTTLIAAPAVLAGLIVAHVLAAGPAAADDPAPAATAASEPAGPDAPRDAALGYLEAARAGDWERAARYLDLRALAPERRSARGPILARELKAVLDRELWVDIAALSNAPEGAHDDGLPPRLERIGTIATPQGPVDVLLERAGGEWRIAAATVAQIPALYEAYGYGPFADYLPPVFFETRVLETALWQWIGLAGLGCLAFLFAWVAALALVRGGRIVTRRSESTFDDTLLELSAGPLRTIVAALVVRAGLEALALAVPVHRVAGATTRALLLAGVAWLLLRVVDMLAREAQWRFASRGNPAAASVVPLGRRTLKVVVGMLAAIVVLQNFGLNVTGFLAGLGVVGLAAALAAQKSLEHFFGGLMLIADRPVQVGDFCRFGDRVGTIEDIGLRSTRVRTLDRTVLSIPNGEFASLPLENFMRRDRIWLSATLGLRYETSPDQLRHVLVQLKRLLLAHPKVDPDPARVRFVGFGAYSLDLEIFAYVRTTDWAEFLAVREDVYLRMMDVVAASGTGFAFPSQTIYAGKDAGLDAERTRAAEAEVERWRAEHRLHLPDVPARDAARLGGTLDYPPEGSSGRR